MVAENLADEKFALTSSVNFLEWLADTGAANAFTTYQAGKLVTSIATAWSQSADVGMAALGRKQTFG